MCGQIWNSPFYRRYYDLISKLQVRVTCKSLLRQGLSEPELYGDLLYKLRKIVGSKNFSTQFIKIISHYKKIGYNINVLMQQSDCLVVNTITFGNFAKRLCLFVVMFNMYSEKALFVCGDVLHVKLEGFVCLW